MKRLFTLLFVCLPVLQAQDAPAVEERLASLEQAAKAAHMAGDNAWMLVCCALVLLMTGPGLALFYGGLVRRKNVLSTLMHSFALMALASIIWGLFGYSLAFGEGNAFIGGTQYLLLNGVGKEPSDYAGVPHLTFMAFQMMFAIITPALISGAYAERMRFSAMLVYTSLWLVIVYFPLAHMVWGTGGLMNAFGDGALPCFDFAGGTVVHISSGVSALVAALYLKPRLGYRQEPMKPHNLILSLTGACLLWVGWFGFNVGSNLEANGLAAQVFANTLLATAAAALSWSFAEWFWRGTPTMLGAASGAVAGLVAITPACGWVGPMGSIVIGLAAGIVCVLAVTRLKAALGYDDSLDVFGVHCVGGILGALLTAVFCNPALGGTGVYDYAANAVAAYSTAAQFGSQLWGVLVTILWSAIVAGAAYALVDATIGLRVTEDEERQGLDTVSHGESAYT